MSRLASTEKGGFYPLPPDVVPLIASHLHAPCGGRLLDPCLGEGEAAAALATALDLDAYGAELHRERAQEATARLEALRQRQEMSLHDPHARRVIAGDYRSLRTSKHGFNLLYLNPPYDQDPDAGRLEYQWLRDTRPWLQPDGVLVLVIPQRVLGFERLATYLAAWFHEVQIWRFPRPAYDRFEQIVLLGRRNVAAVPAGSPRVAHYRDLALQGDQLAPLPHATQPTYQLPTPRVTSRHFFFKGLFVNPEDALTEARQVGVRASTAWRTHLSAPQQLRPAIRPLMPLKTGHLAGMLTAGFLDNQLLHDAESGEQLLVKGRSFKRQRHERYVRELPNGDRQEVESATDVIVTDITTLAPDGTVRSIQNDALEAFLLRWNRQLTRRLADAYPPRYRFNYEETPWAATLARLSLKRQIPRLNAYGLLPAQKHAVAALATRLAAHADAILCGECGSGKTTIGVSVAACLGARRTLVLCPPHLVEKWQREAEIVWPEVDVHRLTSISDVAAFFALDRSRPRLGVLSHSRAKLASGWRAAYDSWQPGRAALLDRLTPPEGTDPDEWWRNQLGGKVRGHAKRRGPRCPDCGARITDGEGIPLAAEELDENRRTLHCHACAAPLFQYDRRRSATHQAGTFLTYARREQQIRAALTHGEPLPAFPLPDGYARWPLATFIRDHYRGQVDLLLADEVHQYKGGSSDQGYAFHDLAAASRKVVGLTGTLYGGKASTLFHLLYRVAPAVRAAFTDESQSGRRRIQALEWSRQYGILERVETRKVDEENGVLTANRRTKVREHELPGASPQMLRWLLDRTVFLSLGDMGYALPGYEEIPVTVEMDAEQAEHYRALYDQLKAELDQRLVREDKSLLGAYLQSLLCWVDAPWRDEVILDPHTKGRETEGIVPRELARVPALPAGRLYPKERAILERVQAEKARGRRCVLYVQQTDTRDVTARWRELFDQHGIRSALLNVAPERRERWIAAQVQAGVDVLITHPRRVETGLDLLGFPTLIWSGIEYSIYTVLQASRRSWRIGQGEDVRVYFYSYAGTLQEGALKLVAAKIAASLRVNGDVIADGSLAELDHLAQQDMVTALTRVVQEGDAGTRSLADAFARANAEFLAAQEYIGEYGVEGIEALEIEQPDTPTAAPEAVQPVPLSLPLPERVASPRRGRHRHGKSLWDTLRLTQEAPSA